ncbi:phosphotriesterase [Nocardia amikacinitolerans]|uniref:phosphotriesterase family protein n=1 Tax=Nocardia amikacinitolerans TaxID=756689 RepID=UPI0020A33ED2|nr:phosphotriesterase-related protein [Nocardia amikacinitolerans]MCP2293335.1 phosphotriesterase-related protein [Nocardia amikacinitolerans]
MSHRTVPSALGEISTADLGITLMHEHLFVLSPDSRTNWVRDWDERQQIEDAVTRLKRLYASGVRTIVDPTVDGLGRDIHRTLTVAEQVPELNILVATGVYTYTDVPSYFSYRGPTPYGDHPEPMIDLFVRDIREGIQGTDVKACLLKCAIDRPGMTAGVERVLRAVAAAHRETGTPIMVHTHPETRSGSAVQRVLDSEGVPPAAVQLAHSGDTTDVDHLSALADAGYLLGMDRFGVDVILGFDDRVATVAEMCRRGYARSMVLSQDAACHIDWIAPELLELLPNWHYQHVLDDVVPALEQQGVERGDITAMLVDNPRRWFERS